MVDAFLDGLRDEHGKTFRGVHAFPVVRDQMQMVQRIECSVCGAVGKNVLNGSRAGDDQLAAHFRRHGWEVDLKRKRHQCPECVAKETERTRKAKEEKKVEKIAAKSEALTVVAPSPNSALAKKIMSDLLFEHYDLTARDYKYGWDDARVAKESGLSEQFVAQRRAQDYGPCSPPKRAIMLELSGMASKVLAKADYALSQFDLLRKEVEIIRSEAKRISDMASDEAKKAGQA